MYFHCRTVLLIWLKNLFLLDNFAYAAEAKIIFIYRKSLSTQKYFCNFWYRYQIWTAVQNLLEFIRRKARV